MTEIVRSVRGECKDAMQCGDAEIPNLAPCMLRQPPVPRIELMPQAFDDLGL